MAYNPSGSRSYGGGGYRGGGGGRSYGGGGHGGGGGGGRGGQRRGPMEMHQATCADCGKSCEVPFRPSGNKPVFCSNCFKGKDGGGGRDFERRDSGGGRRSYGDRDYSDRPPMEMHQAVCTDCGRDCEVPFKPTGDKPIFCDKCFGKNKEIKMGKPSGGNAGNSAELNAKFDMLNIKLDRILKALDVVAAGKITAKEVKTFEAPKTPAKTLPAKAEKTPAKAQADEAKEKAPEKSVIKKVKSGKAKVKKAKG